MTSAVLSTLGSKSKIGLNDVQNMGIPSKTSYPFFFTLYCFMKVINLETKSAKHDAFETRIQEATFENYVSSH